LPAILALSHAGNPLPLHATPTDTDLSAYPRQVVDGRLYKPFDATASVATTLDRITDGSFIVVL